MNKKKRLKVFYLAAEVAPIAKVGGLGDVAGALPKALFKLGLDIRICLPFYNVISKEKNKIIKVTDNIEVPFNQGEKISLWQCYLSSTKILVYLIKHRYFNTKEIYLGQKEQKNNKVIAGEEDIIRFAFFTRASLEAAKYLNFQPDIIHANDWHTALVSDFLQIENQGSNFFKNTKTIYTIHNLANQGIIDPEIVDYARLDLNKPLIEEDLKNGDINFMVQGVLSSDIINTVSPTYAKEILTHYEGAGLDKILKKRKKDIYGILNSIDIAFYNPQTDQFIKQKYSIKNLDKKITNKLALQKKLGWPENKKIALVGLVSRLVWQKGIELVTEKFSRLNCQFVFLGTGDKKYEDYLRSLAKKYPAKFSAQIKFDEALAHQIYAGSDIFLMPSLFEPCGLGQMMAMRYGAVPVVRETGGLKDTIKNYQIPRPPCFAKRSGQANSKFQINPKSKIHPADGGTKANGFSFSNFTTQSLYKTLEQALNVYYYEPKVWRRLEINGMKGDYFWAKSAKEYLKLYKLAREK